MFITEKLCLTISVSWKASFSNGVAILNFQEIISELKDILKLQNNGYGLILGTHGCNQYNK